MISKTPTPRGGLDPVILAAMLAALLVTGLLSACASSTQHHYATRPAQKAWVTPTPTARECLANLDQSLANYTPLRDQSFGTGCSTIGTVRLAWLRSDDAHLQLANLGPVTCSLATTMEGWARYGVDHAARLILGSPLARIDTFGSYNCRNIAGSDHRSAHATANAVDIAAFVLADGRRISVKTDWAYGTPQVRNFLRAVHTSACRRFAIVLTPDYNAAHRDHMHLEVGAPHPVCH